MYSSRLSQDASRWFAVAAAQRQLLLLLHLLHLSAKVSISIERRKDAPPRGSPTWQQLKEPGGPSLPP